MSDAVARTRWSLLFGNFAIGCGVMVVAGSLNDIVRSLQVNVAVGGQLISIGAIVMALCAPLAAALIGGSDRRVLLTLALASYAGGHLLCALAPSYATLVPLRALSVVGAAIFTPQAGAAMGAMAPPEQRGRAITFVLLGWSTASVVGMPVHAYVGETFGWRWAFALVAALSAAGALWVWRVMPAGVKPPPMNLSAWREVLTHPALMVVVAASALSAAGQFTLFSYFAPYFREAMGAGAAQISALFFWFGAFGLLGNVLLSRHIDRLGAARSSTALFSLIALSLALWPLAGAPLALGLAIIPWAFGCFASNSAQQARLGMALPAAAGALLALNTSAIYFGQAVGAAGGGAIVALAGYAPLSWVALAWLLGAVACSHWAGLRMAPRPAHV